MHYKILLTKSFERDLDNTLFYITTKLLNRIAAKNLLKKTKDTINMLTDNPSAFPLLRTRYWETYLIFLQPLSFWQRFFLIWSVSPISSSIEISRNIAILAKYGTAGILFLLRLSIILLWTLHLRQNSFIDISRSLQAAVILLIRFFIISSRLTFIISLTSAILRSIIKII